jgi:nucleotide-binding universal stress UspA family protein
MEAEPTSETGPVVVGLDGSEASLNALRHGLQEAAWRGVELHVVHVLTVTPAVLHLAGDVTITTREQAESDRAEVWRRAEPALDGSEVAVTRVEREGEPGETLTEYSREVGASVLVVGPRGRGRVKEMLLGSTAQAAVRASTCDVLVVKPQARE